MIARDDVVRAAVWAAELTEDELERACRGMVERGYDKGAYICHRGDRLDYWTGVVTGLVKISTISRTGKAMTFAGVGDGGWFGEGSLIKDEARQYDLVAIRDTRLAMMPRSEQDRILGPKERVARNLGWLFNRVLYPGTRGAIEITQEELALLAAVSRPLVNKALQELEAEGLLQLDRGSITVFDREKLARYEA
jgi:CRP-like cAMP-binding protein